MSIIKPQKAFWSFSMKSFSCISRTVQTILQLQIAILQRANRVRGLYKTIKSQGSLLGQFNVRMIILHSLTMTCRIFSPAVTGQRLSMGSILLIQASLLLPLSCYSKQFPHKNHYAGRGFLMKPLQDNTNVSRIAIKTGIKKISLVEESAAGTDRVEICPFSFELLADCRTRNSTNGGKVCPFALEACLLPRHKTHGFLCADRPPISKVASHCRRRPGCPRRRHFRNRPSPF